MRTLSANQIQAMMMEATGLVTLVCVKISHPTWGDYFLVDNTEDIQIGAQVYTAFPFNFMPDDDQEKGKVSAKLTLANPTRTFIEFLRSVTGDVTVTPSIASITNAAVSPKLFSTEMTLLTLRVEQMTATNESIELELVFEHSSSNRFPHKLYNPYDFAGMF